MTQKGNGKAQSKQLVEYLQNHGTVTTIYCREKLSIMHPGGRVAELRKKGVPIKTSWYQQIDASGNSHRAGQYYLPLEAMTPEQQQILQKILAD